MKIRKQLCATNGTDINRMCVNGVHDLDKYYQLQMFTDMSIDNRYRSVFNSFRCTRYRTERPFSFQFFLIQNSICSRCTDDLCQCFKRCFCFSRNISVYGRDRLNPTRAHNQCAFQWSARKIYNVKRGTGAAGGGRFLGAANFNESK